MNMESKKVLLVGVGETGLDVTRIIEENGVEGIAAVCIRSGSELERLAGGATEEAELVILVADLGYENQDSSALQVAKSAKESCKTVAAFLAIPRLFEGEKAINRALETAQALGRELDTALIINKETFNAAPEGPCSFSELLDSLVAIEEEIAGGIQDIMTIITKPDMISLDLEDLKTALAKSGTFAVGSGSGAGEHRIEQAVENALSEPLMKKCDILTSRRVLIKVVAPKNAPVAMEELKAVSDFIGRFPAHTDVKWGVGESDDEDIVSVIILASGFDVKFPE